MLGYCFNIGLVSIVTSSEIHSTYIVSGPVLQSLLRLRSESADDLGMGEEKAAASVMLVMQQTRRRRLLVTDWRFMLPNFQLSIRILT